MSKSRKRNPGGGVLQWAMIGGAAYFVFKTGLLGKLVAGGSGTTPEAASKYGPTPSWLVVGPERWTSINELLDQQRPDLAHLRREAVYYFYNTAGQWPTADQAVALMGRV